MGAGIRRNALPAAVRGMDADLINKEGTMTDLATLQAVHSARGSFYTFCGRCFKLVPDKNFYALLEEMLPNLKGLASQSVDRDLIEGVSGLDAFLEARAGLAGAKLEEFDLETLRKYTSTFCLSNSVVLDESFYTSPEHMLHQESCDHMTALLCKYNYHLDKDGEYYEDHLVVELSFMGRLAFDSAKALGEGRQADCDELIAEQRRLHTEHFDRWIYTVLQSVVDFGSAERLYSSLARLTMGFIREDKLLLDGLT